MRIYLAGPMRNFPKYNFSEFFRIDDALTELGNDVRNPAWM